MTEFRKWIASVLVDLACWIWPRGTITFEGSDSLEVIMKPKEISNHE